MLATARDTASSNVASDAFAFTARSTSSMLLLAASSAPVPSQVARSTARASSARARVTASVIVVDDSPPRPATACWYSMGRRCSVVAASVAWPLASVDGVVEIGRRGSAQPEADGQPDHQPGGGDEDQPTAPGTG